MMSCELGLAAGYHGQSDQHDVAIRVSELADVELLGSYTRATCKQRWNCTQSLSIRACSVPRLSVCIIDPLKIIQPEVST